MEAQTAGTIDVAAELDEIGFTATAMDVRNRDLGLADVTFRLERDADGHTNREECLALAARLKGSGRGGIQASKERELWKEYALQERAFRRSGLGKEQ